MTSGERWATEELEALRAARFGARAWARFLGSSFRRAGATRRARPRLARQARGWSTAGLLLGIAASKSASRAQIAAPAARRFTIWWLATAAMLDWHLGMVEGPGGEQRERLSAADALTMLRLWLIPFLAAQENPVRRSRGTFTALIASAAVSDALDGALARGAGTSRLGRDLDRVADALVVGVAARAASRAGWLPVRTAQLAVIRSGLPVASAAASYFRTGQRPLVDSLGPGRRLAPVLLGGLAAAPFSSRAGAALTSGASVASLALGAAQPGYRAEARRENPPPECRSKVPSGVSRRRRPRVP